MLDVAEIGLLNSKCIRTITPNHQGFATIFPKPISDRLYMSIVAESRSALKLPPRACATLVWGSRESVHIHINNTNRRYSRRVLYKLGRSRDSLIKCRGGLATKLLHLSVLRPSFLIIPHLGSSTNFSYIITSHTEHTNIVAHHAPSCLFVSKHRCAV